MATAPDFAGLLYLNPELTAYSNYATIAQISNAWAAEGPGGSLSLLADSVATPAAFEARVFLGLQDSNVSTLNTTIREAMSNQGISSRLALNRRGQYLANLTVPAKIQSWNPQTKQVVVVTNMPLDPTSIQPGDQVVLQRRERGDSIQVDVETVASMSFTGVTIYSTIRDAILNETEYTVSGIKVVDPQRQALVVYSRLSNPGDLDPNDLAPDETFYSSIYADLYPGTKTLNRENAYVDYRRRYLRDGEYRVTYGGDFYNVTAPYASNGDLYPFPPPSGNSVDTYGYALFLPTAMTVGCNLILADGYSTVTLGDNTSFYKGGPQLMNAASNLFIIAADGDVTIGGEKSNLAIEHDSSRIKIGWNMIDINVPQSNIAIGMPPLLRVESTPDRLVTVTDDVYVQGRMGIGMRCDGDEAYNVDDSGLVASNSTRLAIDGDVYTTGAVVTLSDSNTKSNISLIDDSLERMRRMRGYTWTGGNDRRYTGLLAQEVAEAMPEAVFRAPGGGQAVAYGNLMGLLTESLHRLCERMDALERMLQHHFT